MSPIIKIDPKEIPFVSSAEKLCCKPYPNHPKGCPNYNKKEGCPPDISSLKEVFDFNKDFFLIYTDFNIGEHGEKMRLIHPDWSERQIYCCLYWQPKARKLHHEEVEKYKKENVLNYILNSPEAYKVNVTSLMKKKGVKLEWPPRSLTRLVSLGGTKRCH